MPRSLLLISRQPPWGGTAAREALDILLAGGAFDLPLALLFLDDGVFQLAAGQDGRALQQKDLTANLRALPLFGVESLYVCGSSLQLRGLADAELGLPVEILERHALSGLLDRFDQVITI